MSDEKYSDRGLDPQFLPVGTTVEITQIFRMKPSGFVLEKVITCRRSNPNLEKQGNVTGEE